MLYDNNPQQGKKITLGHLDSSNFTQSHNDHTFQAKEFDMESGLNYFGARYLDAWSGTWTTSDIMRGNLAEPVSQHRTTYVHDNPVNLVDQYGYSAVGNNMTSQTIKSNNTYNITQKIAVPNPLINASGVSNIMKSMQNLIIQPKTTTQGNNARSIFEKMELGNMKNQGSVLNKNPLSFNTNWGTKISNTFSSMFKESQINQVINSFTGPQAERHHRAFALLGLLAGSTMPTPWMPAFNFLNPDLLPELE